MNKQNNVFVLLRFRITDASSTTKVEYYGSLYPASVASRYRSRKYTNETKQNALFTLQAFN